MYPYLQMSDDYSLRQNTHSNNLHLSPQYIQHMMPTGAFPLLSTFPESATLIFRDHPSGKPLRVPDAGQVRLDTDEPGNVDHPRPRGALGLGRRDFVVFFFPFFFNFSFIFF